MNGCVRQSEITVLLPDTHYDARSIWGTRDSHSYVTAAHLTTAAFNMLPQKKDPCIPALVMLHDLKWFVV